ncbi:8606_t:CDS:2, partial [Paraglomus brasilianum]
MLPFRPILSEEESRELETVDVYVSDVEPQEAGKVLKFIQKYCPPHKDLEHAKKTRRINHENGYTLTVLLCQTNSISESDLIKLVAENELDHVIFPRVESVSKHRAYTREQFDAWRVLWPLNYREDPRREINFPTEPLRLHMNRAIELSEKAKSLGEVPIACVIVDPTKSEILAESCDTRNTSNHPLRHAVLNCIAAIGSREKADKAALTTISAKRKSDDICESDEIAENIGSYL